MKLSFLILLSLILNHVTLANQRDGLSFDLECQAGLNRINNSYIYEEATEDFSFKWDSTTKSYIQDKKKKSKDSVVSLKGRISRIDSFTEFNDRKQTANPSTSGDPSAVTKFTLHPPSSRTPYINLVDFMNPDRAISEMVSSAPSKKPAAHLTTTFTFKADYLIKMAEGYEDIIKKDYLNLEDAKKIVETVKSLAASRSDALPIHPYWTTIVKDRLKDLENQVITTKKARLANSNRQTIKAYRLAQDDRDQALLDLDIINSNNNLDKFALIDRIRNKVDDGSLLKKRQESVKNIKLQIESEEREAKKFRETHAKYGTTYIADLSIRVLTKNSSWINNGHSLEVTTEFYELSEGEKTLLGYRVQSSDHIIFRKYLEHAVDNHTLVVTSQVINPDVLGLFYDTPQGRAFREDLNNTLREKNVVKEGPDGLVYDPDEHTKLEKSKSTIYLQSDKALLNKQINEHMAVDLLTSCKLTIKRIDGLKRPSGGLLCSGVPESYSKGEF